MKINILLFITLFLGCSLATKAQLSRKEKQIIINDVLKVVQAKYVFPEVAARMQKSILQNLNKGQYDTISKGAELAFQLTWDLQKISKDQHLKVSYEPKTNSKPETNGSPREDYNTWLNNLLKENNFGIKERKILPGNIGYLNIPMFGPLDKCVDTLITAMRSVENTAALIIDLRTCRGSLDENTIPFLCSYFFTEPVHLFDFYTRENNTTKQFWTAAWVPGKRYVGKPVYILTSGRTFSGGEEMAYDLQQQKRAVLIGETTRGGANPNELVAANTDYKVTVPYARSVNPVTKTNWEQVGVTPDTLVKSNLALYAAHLAALTKLLGGTSSEAEKANLAGTIQTVKAHKPQFKNITFTLKGFENAKEVAVAGSFNSWARKSLLLKREGNQWTGTAEAEPGRVSYMFIVDGRWLNDPENNKTIKEGDRTNSYLVVQP